MLRGGVQQLLVAGSGPGSQSIHTLSLGSWLGPQAATGSASAGAWQRIVSLLPNLAEVQLMAVPKSKVRSIAGDSARGSRPKPPWPPPAAAERHPPHAVQVTPHRKGKRSANKFIRFVPVVAQCSKCQRVFQQHQVPSKCDDDACPAFNLRARPAQAEPQQAAPKG
jgi:hypothetical protein